MCLTPRAQWWVGSMAIGEEQSAGMAVALAESGYTSVEVLSEELPHTLMALPAIEALKPGAKIALRKKLADLKVLQSIASTAHSLACVCLYTHRHVCIHTHTYTVAGRASCCGVSNRRDEHPAPRGAPPCPAHVPCVCVCARAYVCVCVCVYVCLCTHSSGLISTLFFCLQRKIQLVHT